MAVVWMELQASILNAERRRGLAEVLEEDWSGV